MRRVLLAVVMVGVLGVGQVSQGLTTSLIAEADTYIRDASEARGTFTFVDVRGFSGADFVAYIRFNLSGLGNIEVREATLSLYKVAGSRNDTITTGRHEVQGLLDLPGNTPQDWVESGPGALNTLTVGLEYNPAAPNSVDLSRVVNLDMEDGANVVETVGDAPVPTTLSGPDLVSFLNSRVAAGGLVTFIVSINASNDRGYGFASRENATVAYWPRLDLTYVPVPEPGVWVLAGVGLSVVGGWLKRKEKWGG